MGQDWDTVKFVLEPESSSGWMGSGSTSHVLECAQDRFVSDDADLLLLGQDNQLAVVLVGPFRQNDQDIDFVAIRGKSSMMPDTRAHIDEGALGNPEDLDLIKWDFRTGNCGCDVDQQVAIQGYESFVACVVVLADFDHPVPFAALANRQGRILIPEQIQLGYIPEEPDRHDTQRWGVMSEQWGK